MYQKRLFPLCICLFGILLFSGCERVGLRPPLSVRFRESRLDSSTRVLILCNRTSDETMVINVHVVNKKEKQESEKAFALGPGKKGEIGFLEMGWCFEPGEEVTLHVDGYPMSISVTVP